MAVSVFPGAEAMEEPACARPMLSELGGLGGESAAT